MSNTHSLHHRRLSNFVDWIATNSEKEEDIRAQAGRIRVRIKTKASEDGLVVRSTPNSGSFAKRTGLRRHMQGNCEIEGQDVDLPFVVSPATKEDAELDALLPRFERYARAAYPDNFDGLTKSSVKLRFVNTKLNYDLVPMLATDDNERQILLRGNGERRETSVQSHIEFIRGRTRQSNVQTGRVKFNECLRLAKWWRHFLYDADEVPTIVIDLLCAKAFDQLGVQTTYAETLVRWFGYLAQQVRRRTPIYFSDYQDWSSPPQGDTWAVIDPVNKDNNITQNWRGYQVDALANHLANAADRLNDAISYDLEGEYSMSLLAFEAVLGSPIRHHCGDRA